MLSPHACLLTLNREVRASQSWMHMVWYGMHMHACTGMVCTCMHAPCRWVQAHGWPMASSCLPCRHTPWWLVGHQSLRVVADHGPVQHGVGRGNAVGAGGGALPVLTRTRWLFRLERQGAGRTHRAAFLAKCKPGCSRVRRTHANSRGMHQQLHSKGSAKSWGSGACFKSLLTLASLHPFSGRVCQSTPFTFLVALSGCVKLPNDSRVAYV